MPNEEERIALFLDYENLALGARDRGEHFDMAVLMDALTERGRIVVRRAYGDWNLFTEHRKQLVDQRVELIEIPQRSESHRKNAADIKLAVDAIELAYERTFVTTFVVASGDSDFTPLVSKLRELDKRVIGVGVEGSTSHLLPGACDEFLFYERLAGTAPAKPAGRVRDPEDRGELSDVARMVTRTLSGLQRSIDGPVLSSMLKRALVRKDPTFAESDYGFRAWGELMKYLEDRGVIALQTGSAQGDPVVGFPAQGGAEKAFELLRAVVDDLERGNGAPALSGLKNELRKRRGDFSEKDLGYGGFLQFVKAAAAKGVVRLEWDDESEDSVVSPGRP